MQVMMFMVAQMSWIISKSRKEIGDKECETRDNILREKECTYYSVTSVVHLDWDRDEQQTGVVYTFSWEKHVGKEYSKKMHASLDLSRIFQRF